MSDFVSFLCASGQHTARLREVHLLHGAIIVNNNIYINGSYLKTNPLYHIEDSPWKAQQILKMLSKHDLQINSVCEIGCGAGEVLRQLQIYLPEKTMFSGYEISPQAFELCKQRENIRLNFYCGDLLSLEDTNETNYDVLLCMDVIEHVEDYIGFLRKMRRKAHHKIFHIPLDMSAKSVLQCAPILAQRTTVGHLHYFMKETALLTLQTAGYHIVDYFYTPAMIDRGKSLRAKLPRIIFSSLFGQDAMVRMLGGYSLLVLAM